MADAVVWVLTHERQVQRAALAVAAVAVLLVVTGLARIFVHRWREANRLIDRVREDVRRAEHLDHRNRLEDRDLFAVAAHCDGREFQP